MKKIFILSLLLLIIVNFSSTGLMAGFYNRGRTYYVYKKFDKAKKMFLKAVESRNHGDSYYFLGEIEKLQGNYKEAIEYFSKAIKANTTRKYKKNAYWNLIVISEMNGDYESLIQTCKYMWKNLNDRGAKKKVEKIINKALWSNNKEAIKKYKTGLKLKKKGKTEKAINLFQEAIRIEPGFLAPKFELGMYAYNDGEFNRAASYLNEIVSRIPIHADVHLILAEIYFKNKNYSSAIEHFSKALEFGFNNKKTIYYIKLRRGISYYNYRNYEPARADINDVLIIKNRAIEPLILLAAINIKLNNYKNALKVLIEANKIDNKNPNILYRIGSIYYKQNNWKYISYFDRLFDITKKNKNRKKYYRAFKILLKSHSSKKNNNRVIEIASTLDDINNNYKIILILAKTYYSQKKFDNAIDYLEKISLNDDDKFILCKAYYRSGRKNKAKEILLSLILNNYNYDKAKKDVYLSKIIKSIDKEKKEREEKQKQEKLEKEKVERERIKSEKEKERQKNEKIKNNNESGKKFIQ